MAGDIDIGDMGDPLVVPNFARSVRRSGKLGGVAGVLAGGCA